MQATEQHGTFVAGLLGPGVVEAYRAHVAGPQPGPGGGGGGAPAAADAKRRCEAFRPMVESLGGLWAAVVQPDKAVRNKFLASLLKPFDDARWGTGGRGDGTD